MSPTQTGWVRLAVVAAALFGCDEGGELAPGGSDDIEYGSAQLALQEVPGDVACVSIHVTGRGGHAEEHAFDVEPGEETVYRDLRRLRTGPTTFRAEAFGVPCVAKHGTRPNYDSDPAIAQIRPNQAAHVTLFMRGVGAADVTLEFPGDDECLPRGEVCVDAADCCSGVCRDNACTQDEAWDQPEFPANAVMVTAEEFEAHREAGLLQPHNGRIDAEVAGLRRLEEEEDARLVAELLARRPDLASFVNIVPGDAAQPNGDGNWRHLINLGNGDEQEVVVYGQAAWNAILAEALRVAPTPANQVAAYRGVYNLLPREHSAGLIDPDALSRLDPDEIRLRNRRFFMNWRGFADALFPIDPNLPLGYVADCDLEEGAGNGLDRQACEGYSATGIMENISWPGKYFATCVKNQGGRGSCSGFAATSGVEHQVAQHHGRWVNLSEQMVYGKYKLDWYPNHNNHGSYISKYFSRSMQDGFFFPFETQWEYNTSDSCGGYADSYCSATTHQAKLVCIAQGFCGYALKPITPAGFLPKAGAVLDIEDKDLWLSMVIMNLIVGNAVMVGTGVPPSWDNAPGNGFASMGLPNEESRGGHGVHVTGFVTNERLAAELPNAPPGQGGGYLVVKNSWGSCWKDGGYIYVPFDWAKKWMGGSYALHSVW